MTKSISVTLSDDQYELARRRAFVEDLTWSRIFRGLINAYIAGDITVTQQGRYSVNPPKAPIPVVHVRRDANITEIEPDWKTNDKRPQVGVDDPKHQTKRGSGWGTAALQQHLGEETGRKISRQYLRNLLKLLKIEKADNGRWDFAGPMDPQVKRVIEAVENGTYDEMVRIDLTAMKRHVGPEQTPVEEHEVKHRKTKRQRIADRLRQLED